MVTGELPFGKTSGPLDAWMKKVHNELTVPRKLVPSLSERVDWAIRRSMAADPNLRPASCREFIEDLTGHSTRKITTPSTEQQQQAAAQQDLWYLVYKDDDGTMHTVKGTTEGIRRSLKENLLGDASNVRACKQKTGPFEPLAKYAEFRDLAAQVAAGGGAASSSSKVNSAPSAWKTGSGSNSKPDSADMPHIPMNTKENQAMGWLMTLFLGMLGGATALIALYFMTRKP
jgi:hypothetical protein